MPTDSTSKKTNKQKKNMAIILKIFSYRKWVVIEKRKSTIIIIIIIIIIITNINSGSIYKSNGSSPCKLKKI